MRARIDSKFAATSKAYARLAQKTAVAGLGTNRKSRAEAAEITSERLATRSDSAVNLLGEASSASSIASQLKDMQAQLNALKRAMHSQTALMTQIGSQQSAAITAVTPSKKTIGLRTETFEV